jgi:hypothetical protein
MPDIDIQGLVWDDWNRQHVWDRHQLTPEMVEEVCYGNADKLHAEQTYGGRYLVVGPRRGGRLYAVVLAPQGAWPILSCDRPAGEPKGAARVPGMEGR